jgi:hypothetical protein
MYYRTLRRKIFADLRSNADRKVGRTYLNLQSLQHGHRRTAQHEYSEEDDDERGGLDQSGSTRGDVKSQREGQSTTQAREPHHDLLSHRHSVDGFASGVNNTDHREHVQRASKQQNRKLPEDQGNVEFLRYELVIKNNNRGGIFQRKCCPSTTYLIEDEDGQTDVNEDESLGHHSNNLKESLGRALRNPMRRYVNIDKAQK